MGWGQNNSMEEERQSFLGDKHDNKRVRVEEEEEVREGGWGWVVVLASFTVICLIDGVGYSFGVFLEPLITEMEEARGLLSMAGSMQVGVYSCSSPLVALFVARYSERKACMLGSLLGVVGLIISSYATGIKTLLLGYSIITGLGFGLMYLPSVVTVSQHFTVRRSLATGIVLCAAGAGTFLLAPLAQVLLDTFGWRGAMRVLAALCLICLLCGAAMTKGAHLQESGDKVTPSPLPLHSVPRPRLARLLGDQLASYPDLHILLLVAAGDGMTALSLYIPYTHLPPAAVAAGLTTSQAAFLISIIGVTNSLGRVVSGWMADQAWSNPIVMIACSLLASVPSLYLLSAATSFWLFILLCCQFGFLLGIWGSAVPPTLIKLLGVPLLGPAFSLLTAVRGVAALSGPPLAGAVVDMLDSKPAALVTAGAGMTVAGLLYLLTAVLTRRLETRKRYQEI